ncbi:MAG TPA: SCO family protein [Novimethylophilus sp.]|jgi:protein SCO1/2|uniref:SCO family protein n=1 Tax=Novimethylophilus sp. TaxID=2137426 RepID=UPI002F42BDBB
MRSLVLVILLCGLLGCSAKQQSSAAPFVGTDVSGARLGDDLGLVDHNGQLRHLSDFKGDVVALFFGYTHCPDVCPTTMADLAKATRLLGARSKSVRVLFVTLDPARDTAEVLRHYVPSFDPGFIGLRGDEAGTKKVAQDFKIFYSRQESASKAGYSLDHSGGVYIFDKKGNLRVYLNFGQKPLDIAHDFKLLLDE